MWKRAFGGLVGGFGASYFAHQQGSFVRADGSSPAAVARALKLAGARRRDLPDFSLAEVGENASKNGKGPVWVTYKDGVYDITDFVEAHPGGDKLLMAAGTTIEPYWQIYQVHRESAVTLQLLESMRVGNVHPEDRKKQLAQQVNDPYANEPSRSADLEILSLRPFNAEPSKDVLAENYFTPNGTFYVRNHLPVPQVKVEDYKLVVKAGDSIKKEFSLEYLKKNFPHATVPVTIQCAGNRRRGMSKVRGVDGLMWDSTAISTAEWTGVRLADVLRHVGVTESFVHKHGLRHVVFEGMDGGLDGKYGASISFERAYEKGADVLIAWEMNGEELPADHGYPARLVAPGLVGARSVKWLESIVVSPDESQSIWQQKDYKNIGPSHLNRMSSANAAKEAPPVREMPVQSAILSPEDKDELSLKDNTISLKGYAWGGGGRGIQRVDLTMDGGHSWTQAELCDTQDRRGATQKYSGVGDTPNPNQWAWTLWQADLPVDAAQNKFDVCVKAVNSANDTQPETPMGIWNLRGLLNNSWHCIELYRE